MCSLDSSQAGGHNSASRVLICELILTRTVRTCTHTHMYTACICKMLIFMHFLFGEERKYLLNTQCFTNPLALIRKLDGGKICFSNKGGEDLRG